MAVTVPPTIAGRTTPTLVVVAMLAFASSSGADEQSMRRCRAAIGRLAKVALKGFEAVDVCQMHANRDCDSRAQCLVLPSLDTKGKYGDAKAKATARIDEKCAGESLVADNYAGGTVETRVLPLIDATIEQDSFTVLHSDDLNCDRSKTKCFETIARERTYIVRKILEDSVRCQRDVDRHATTFGPMSPSCVGNALSLAPSLVDKATRNITGACSLTDLCDLPAPPCPAEYYSRRVAQVGISAGADATQLVQEVYYVPAHCGDGVVERGEECDDGNRNDADACRNNCTNAGCGDGVVQVGVEECDEGAAMPTATCVDCHVPGATCGPGGVQVTVSLVFNAISLNSLGGLIVNLGYGRAAVSIPGSADDASVLERVEDLTGLGAFFNDHDTDGDGVDDNLLDFVASTTPLSPGPLERVHFDCTQGSFIDPQDFDCSIDGPSDIYGNPLVLSPALLSCTASQMTSIAP